MRLEVTPQLRNESRHLVVISNTNTPSAVDDVGMNYRLNHDSGANYNIQALQGFGAVPSAVRATGVNASGFLNIPGSNNLNSFGGGTLILPHAFNEINHKASSSFGGSAEIRAQIHAGRWANINPVEVITLLVDGGGNFGTGSTFTLAGLDRTYLIEEQILTADGLFSFTNIPAVQGNLVVVAYVRSDRAANTDNMNVDINTDTVDGNYARQFLFGQGGAGGAAAAADRRVGEVPGDNQGANQFGAFTIGFAAFNRGEDDPYYVSVHGYHGSVGGSSLAGAISGRRNNVAAITQLDFTPIVGTNFIAGSMMSLYYVPNRRLIQRQTLLVDTASVTFSAIPATTFDGNIEALSILLYGRSDRAAIDDDVDIEINGDAEDANYERQFVVGIGAAITAGRASTRELPIVPGNTAGANIFGGGDVLIPDHVNTSRHKARFSVAGTTAAVRLFSTRWKNVAAVTSVTVRPRNGTVFRAGTVVELEAVVDITSRDASFFESS